MLRPYCRDHARSRTLLSEAAATAGTPHVTYRLEQIGSRPALPTVPAAVKARRGRNWCGSLPS